MPTAELHALPVVELKAAAGDAPESRRRTFSIMAYSGAPMRVEGFAHPVVIDLNGLRAAGQRIPILRDHDARKVIGQSEIVSIGPGGVQVEGIVTGETGPSADVVTHARNGFKWQASVGADVERRETLKAGEKATVNGREVQGPLIIVRAARLYETSFVALGADHNTTVNVAASKSKGVGAMAETITTDAAPVSDLEPIEATRAVETAEAERVRGILAAAGPDADQRLVDSAIESGESLTAFKSRLFDLSTLRSSRPNLPLTAYIPRSDPGVAGNPRETLTASAMLLGGHDQAAVRAFGERVVAGLRRPEGWHDLCVQALRADGRDVPHGRSEVIRAGFSTISMPFALNTSIEKVALGIFAENSANWRPLARRVSAQNFRAGKALRLTAKTALNELPPAGEFKHGVLSEDAFTYRVKTYGRMFQLTREDVVNDDAGLLNDLPTLLGVESARTVSDLFFDLVIANTGSHWSVGNNNLITTALGLTGLSDAVKKLRTQVDSDDRIIGFQPVTLVVPAALEQTARALLNSVTLMRDQASDNQPTGNPIAGLNLALVVEPRLDAASTIDWYLFARPSDAPMLVSFLNGREGVIVESQEAAFNTLGMQWRAFMDTGVDYGEPKASVKADVTA